VHTADSNSTDPQMLEDIEDQVASSISDKKGKQTYILQEVIKRTKMGFLYNLIYFKISQYPIKLYRIEIGKAQHLPTSHQKVGSSLKC